MKKLLLALSASLVLFITSVEAQSCQVQDSLELVKLYQATQGNGWIITWNFQKPVKYWNGVKLSSTGRVTSIVLQTNQLKGNIPNLSLPQLKELKLGFNELQGTIPNFNALPVLKELYLSSNQLSGSIPKFENLKGLYFLDISNNQLTGNIPDFSFLELEQINFASNKLEGPLPSLKNCPGLKKINVTTNKLSGNVPTFGGLVRLEEIDLSYNQFSGNLPDFNIYTLNKLDVSHNRITGNIPDFKQLPKLRKLYLQNNALTGNLPDFSALTNVQEINICNNHLSGTLPPLKKLTKLQNLNIAKNAFTFDGIENHVLQPYTVIFTPQDSIELYKEGNKLYTQTVCKDSTSYFAWYRNDTLIGNFMRGNATLTLTREGKYRCMLKNANHAYELTTKIIHVTKIEAISLDNGKKKNPTNPNEIVIPVIADGKYLASLFNENDDKIATQVIESGWEKETGQNLLRLRFSFPYNKPGKYSLRIIAPSGAAPINKSVIISEKGEWNIVN